MVVFFKTKIIFILMLFASSAEACIKEDIVISIYKEKKSVVGNYYVDIQFSHAEGIEAIEYYLYENQRDLRFPLGILSDREGGKYVRILVDDIAFNSSALNIRLNMKQIECMNIFKLNEMPLKRGKQI